MRIWLSLGTACIFSGLGRGVGAQAPCADSLTTRSGIYTTAQAQRGREVYAGYCRSCHTPESHTGATFNAWWNKHTLWDLYAFIRDRMPKNEPSSLSDEEYAAVTAYLLRMNKMPAGANELPMDSLVMKTIRIETAKSP